MPRHPRFSASLDAIGGAVYWLAHSLSCPPALAALCAILAMILATGATTLACLDGEGRPQPLPRALLVDQG